LNPTKTTDTLARLWRWSAYLGGVAGAALSGTLLLAAPPRPFPPAFAPVAPPPAVAPTASPIPTKVRDGPDLFPSSASPIPTKVREGPDLFPTAATTSSSVAPIAPPVLPIAPTLLTRDDAVRWALQYNPEIAAIRQQHGIARSGIVIANTYPFNPTVETRARGVSAPVSSTITNRVDLESNLLWEVELRGQQRLRQEGAAAGLSRTDNEIAFQELTLAVRAGRAFDTLLYRIQKAALADEAVRLTKEDVERVRKLLPNSKVVRPPDLFIIQAELNDFIAVAGAAHAAVASAETELRRALGIVDMLEINDTLETLPLHLDAKTLVTLAIDRRPDRQAHEAAVAEAESRLALERANQYGNISIGASYGYDPTRINTIGGIISVPIPIFNRHNGEIRQREAERERAVLELRQSEIDIVHDVEGALARMEAARRWAEMYRTTLLPEMKSAVEGIEKLFKADDPGVDLPRLIDVHRKLLRARDGYLDAQWELRQAQADLAAALGDPALLAPSLRGLCVPPPH
jgi:outer membrane protein TolC